MLPCNYNHLYYFYRVAVHKSVSRASKELLIAQSALSTQLKQLEESFETTLFNRTKGGMDLTEDGELVFEYAMQMFQTFDDMKRAIALAEKEVKGPLNIAAVHSIGVYLIPGHLARFHKKFPEVRINLELHSSNRVMELLQENLVDLSLITWNRQYPQLASTVLMQNDMVLVASPKHPFLKKRGVAVKDLKGEPFIGYEAGTPTRILMDAHFKGLGIVLDYVIEVAQVGTIIQLAVAGMGLALLPRFTVRLELEKKDLKAIDIPEVRMERPVTLYWKERRALSRPAQEFIRFIRDASKTESPRRVGSVG